ncbi:MAG: DNA-directed RNA polymerase subunit beta' [Candidatus Dormibacteria bacterium]
MLKLENFDALKLSLASPETILSWSHGEVTKPETINYRTLRPERDGLFCEKIFGPTKDWECHCGKYKRYRYKGIICDKCGVEVTRSKVRRERMGHIRLASPVSHVWYFKGIPSRLGLLLDMSPRNLEKVLYFANYIVTSVDEEARERELAALDPEQSERVKALVAAKSQESQEAVQGLEQQIAELEASNQAQQAELEQAAETRRQDLEQAAEQLQERITAAMGRKAPSDFQIKDGQEKLIVAKKGVQLTEEHQAELQELLRARLEAIAAEADAAIQAARERVAGGIAQARSQLAERGGAEGGGEPEELEALRQELADTKEKLQALTARQLLNDAEYRDYTEKFGSVFHAAMGAAAIKQMLEALDLSQEATKLREELQSTSGQRKQKAIKRLRVVEAFRSSETAATWMILEVLPVIPPELRPMVQLDGGRFATSDLNDLYRRVINRNNRLKRLLELGAPEIIVRNEKRMLQEAVDALIDNGRRGRAITGTGNRKLKSLSDMLKGKQGRFRQNLLGKRVDYSGRSVIVVGPELKLNQCGLPKRMALELFKPFVMRELVEKGFTQNIKSAKRMVERARPEVWDVLDEVIQDHPVLLNRAPTLHRLGIQAFMPVLVEGSAIQIHPLVCTAFNADFDGDQMAVHVPLFSGAIAEAKNLMMSSNNILSASDGNPVVAPTQDMVLGSFWLTMLRQPLDGLDAKELHRYSSTEEVLLAHDTGAVATHQPIQVRLPRRLVEAVDPGVDAAEKVGVVTTPGRVIFNEVLPLALEVREGAEGVAMVFQNRVFDRKELRALVAECYALYGNQVTASVVNDIKRLGFDYATRSGVTLSAMDIKTPPEKQAIIDKADSQVDEVGMQHRRGLITEDERYAKTVEIWTQATEAVTQATMAHFDPFSSVLMMSQSGARGTYQQIRQLAGMRGLMADPTGRIIDMPIKANFSEGLEVLEYFISTHGARKGLADTALRTADSGYLTRRLVDVAQDVIVREEDCGTTGGIWLTDLSSEGEPFIERLAGRIAASEVVAPDGTVVVGLGEEITDTLARQLAEAGVARARVRSVLTCGARNGVCRYCYGRNLATGRLVEIGEAVGVIAAQSIGEPGTQLTMRTFHTGGVAGLDITQGLPRVEELFEARIPKGKAILAEAGGRIEIIRGDAGRKVRVVSHEEYETGHQIDKGLALDQAIVEGTVVSEGQLLARGGKDDKLQTVNARVGGRVVRAHVGRSGGEVRIRTVEEEVKEYPIPHSAQLKVADGDEVRAGDALTVGSISPQELLYISGREAVQDYLVREVQRVYRSQGVDINDKHIEVIVRQMMRKVRVESGGDTELLPGEIVSQWEYDEANAKVLAEGGEPAIAATVLLGLIKAALNTASWLSAASFQETTRVLTEAAISGKVDRLRGLKENVIIGKLIPAGTGLDYYRKLREEAVRYLEAAAEELPEQPAGEDGLAVAEGFGDAEAALPTLDQASE